jgi:two-component system, cell cycle sensor histidine kinase and response regulator CckA
VPAPRLAIDLIDRADSRQVLKGMIQVTGIAAVLALLVAISVNDHKALTACVGALMMLPGLLWLIKKGHDLLAGLLWCFVLLSVATFVTVFGSGIHDVGMLIFPVVILLSGLLLQRWVATFMILLSCVCPVMVGVTEVAQWIHPPVTEGAVIGDIPNLAIILLAVGFLVRIITRTLYRSLERTFVTEQRHSQLFNATHDGIIVADPQSQAILDVNAATVRLFGIDRETFLASRIEVLASGVADRSAAIAEYIKAAVAEGEHTVPWEFSRQDNRHLDLEISFQVATLGNQPRVLAVVRDVSERKAMERSFREGENLRVVGQIARGVAHDFNNQLAGIVGSATFLEEPLRNNPDAQEHLSVIQKSAKRSADLVSQLLAFARKDKRHSDALDCEMLLSEVEQLLSRSIDKRIQVKVNKPSEPVVTLGDSTLLENAILNLALNGRDAITNEGCLTLSCDWATIDATNRSGLPSDFPNGRYARIAVADTGSGIPSDAIAHIFEPFFTTKATGNGMGLAAVYGTVQSHEGAIRVESEVGKGTTFEIFLPAAAPGARITAKSVVPPEAEDVLTGLRILVADDEATVLRLTARLLQKLGCVVQTASSGMAAIEALKSAIPAPQLVILDHDMPGLSGSETVREIRAFNATVPIIISSGYGGELSNNEDLQVQGYLPKPYSIEALATAVRLAVIRDK